MKHRSTGHQVTALADGRYRLIWWGDPIRSPQAQERITDKAGAERFANRHNLTLPTLNQTTP